MQIAQIDSCVESGAQQGTTIRSKAWWRTLLYIGAANLRDNLKDDTSDSWGPEIQPPHQASSGLQQARQACSSFSVSVCPTEIHVLRFAPAGRAHSIRHTGPSEDGSGVRRSLKVVAVRTRLQCKL